MTSFRHVCFWFYFHPVGNSLVISLTWSFLAIPGLLLIYDVIEPDPKNKLTSNYFVGIEGREELRDRTHIALYWYLIGGFIRACSAVWLSSSNYRGNGWSPAAQIWTPVMAIGLAGDLIIAILYFTDPFVAKWKNSFDESDNLSAFLMSLACIRCILFWIIDVVALISGIMLIRKSHIERQMLLEEMAESVTYSKSGVISADGRVIPAADFYSMDWRTKHANRQTNSLPTQNASPPVPPQLNHQSSLVYKPPSKIPPSSQNGKIPAPNAQQGLKDGRHLQGGISMTDSSVRTWTEFGQESNSQNGPANIPNPPPPPPPGNPKPKPEVRNNGRPIEKRGPPVAPKPPMRKVLHALITGEGFKDNSETRPTSYQGDNRDTSDHKRRILQRSESVPIPKPDYNVPNYFNRNVTPMNPIPDYFS